VLTTESDTPRGPLRITAPNDLGTLLLADVVTRFAQRYPDVQVEMVLTARTVDLVGEGIDLAVRAGVLRDSSLVAKKIADTELRLFASPAYLAKRGTPRSVSDLASHDCVLFRAKNGRARWTLECRAEKTSVEVSGGVSGDDFAFLVQAAAGGAGIGLLPRFTAESELRAGRLQRVLPTHAASSGAIYVVHASSKHVPRKVAAFRDFLVESLRSLPPL
jgi:DNA-binding transcriptional LysR family regulator